MSQCTNTVEVKQSVVFNPKKWSSLKAGPARPSSLNTGPAKPKTWPGQTPYYVIAVLRRDRGTVLREPSASDGARVPDGV